MTIPADERRARITGIVRELGTVRVVDLAARLGVPAVTVRRDVAALAHAGRLRRSHGAVSLPPGPESAGRSGRADGRGRVVGMLVPAVGSSYDEVIAGARSAAAAAGARLVLGVARSGAGDERAQVERLLESAADGLLLTPGRHPAHRAEEYDWLAGLPVPAVLVEPPAGPVSPGTGLDAVGADHRHGVLLALRHLRALGHRGVLLAARGDTRTARAVRTGYAEAVRLLDLEPQPVLDPQPPGTPSADPDPDPDPERVADRIAAAAGTGVRAVLVHDDQDAIHLPSLLRARGLRVPDDVALISYGDGFAALAAPPLTAVASPDLAVGATALDLLLRRLSAGAELPAHHVALLPSLKVRTSCGGAG
ncbi:substrate-binding domain-containing protein [Kitasatospora sp. NPDC088346]|uniref:substrate-binding domain-containing protein n=1 Tax=Kitasatospora sp. NPDC088346 TaxID=3364073 RepID=UPI0037F222F1